MSPLKSLALALALALPASACLAYESHTVHRADGQAMFEIRFFDVGDGFFMPSYSGSRASTWNLDAMQKSKILQAMQYWADVIKPASGHLPAVVNVGTYNVENAAGLSPANSKAPWLTQLQTSLLGGDPGLGYFDSQAQFVMGTFDWETVPYVPAQVPPTGRVDVMSTAAHELAHGLGITSSVGSMDEEGKKPYFLNEFSSWNQHLRDDNGRPAKPGQTILCKFCTNPYSPDAFDLRQDKGYFAGAHVSEVLAGAMPGVPVKILWEAGDGIDTNYMSHSELKNSTMSHQSYGNYAVFMEAELAALQDLGYDIDRRNFYGRSIYNDGLTVINEHGYFQRNAQGTDYLPGTYNTALLGVGLHVYGSGNTIYQRADLLTEGPGGVGVRVDGQSNTLVVEAGTRIHGNGLNGRGVVFAYGRDHVLVQRGQVQALGELGVAANFDFGSSTLGDDTEYRGSYIRSAQGKALPLLEELQGAQVKRYDLTGSLAGRQAAILMSRNALVEHINVMRGASIQGDIISYYAEKDEQGRLRLSQLSFGQLADASGQATGRPDAGFALNYQGNILGSNIALSAQGGLTSLNGQHVLHSVRVQPGATLAGNSRYSVLEGAFVNDGIVAPGNSLGRIEIEGDYLQGPQGTLALEVDGRGGHDTLAVSGQASLDGQLAVIPLQDWYPAGWSVGFDQLIETGATSGAFAAVNAQAQSPTLDFQVAAAGLTARRAEHAYSRWAPNDNARQAGLALDGIAAVAQPDIQPLYAALDFSAPDGSLVADALEPLSGAAYSALFAGALQRERQIAGLGLRNAQAATEGQWRGYAAAFGSSFSQDRRGSQLEYDTTAYGAVFGAHTLVNDWTVGAYGAVSELKVKVRDPHQATGRSSAVHLGLQARYEPRAMAGPFAFGQGQLGVEDGKMNRQLHIGSYQASHRSNWTGYSGALAAGGGYRWALSPSLSMGPVASLAYTYLRRPGTSESGPEGTRLELRAASFSSLRSSLGVESSLNLPLKNEATLKAQVQVAWEHELLNRELSQRASFSSYDAFAFSTRNTVTGADALAVTAALSYAPSERLSIGASMSSQFLRAGYRSFSGNLALHWKF